jgi:phosphoglycolate phosphatase-like HAD superfamily hydrolase
MNKETGYKVIVADCDAVMVDLNKDIANTTISMLDNLRKIKVYTEEAISRLEKFSASSNPGVVTSPISLITEEVGQLKQRHSIVMNKWSKIECYQDMKALVDTLK